MSEDMQSQPNKAETKPRSLFRRKKRQKGSLLRWARNRFFTGVVVAIPIVSTFLVVSWIIQKIDNNVFKLVPARLNPETYLGFAIPGLGLIISFVLLFFLGMVASNFIGKSLIKSGESLLDRVPVVSPCLLYTSPSPRDRTRSRMPSSA